jgi:hypothetical protein
MADDQRKTGRPPVDPTDPQKSVGVHLRLPSSQYDRTYQRASAAGVSVPEQLRRDLRDMSGRRRS